jgi:transcriptional regulator with XRE-family HTH domain
MVGEKIRTVRVVKGYSQEYMAFNLNISQNSYSKIERNITKVTLERVYEIADILNIQVTELLPT